MFDGIDVHQAIPVIRAFSHFALLANLAEDIHRERRRGVTSPPGSRRRTAASPRPTLKLDRPTSTRPPSPTR